MTDSASREIRLSVLGFQEEGEWVAIALEMDLRGYGATFEAAQEDLLDHVAMQCTFALEKGNFDMIFFPAEGRYWQAFSDIRVKALRAQLGSGEDVGDHYKIGDLALPDRNRIAQMAGQYTAVDA